jgi:hypothetical protein
VLSAASSFVASHTTAEPRRESAAATTPVAVVAAAAAAATVAAAVVAAAAAAVVAVVASAAVAASNLNASLPHSIRIYSPYRLALGLLQSTSWIAAIVDLLPRRPCTFYQCIRCASPCLLRCCVLIVPFHKKLARLLLQLIQLVLFLLLFLRYSLPGRIEDSLNILLAHDSVVKSSN